MKRFCLNLGLLLLAGRLAAADLYVAPAGNDANPGTLDRPFATLSRARDAIRSIKAGGGLPSGGMNVWLRGGYYNHSSTLTLDARDAGTASAPIRYASHPGEQALVTGATRLDPSWFQLVSSSSPLWNRMDSAARGNIYAVNLAAQGITNFGQLRQRGFSMRALGPMELFVGGQPMTLARWPNQGEPLARTASALSNTQVVYTGSRPDRWTNARDAWVHGFWATAWADFHLPLGGVDPNSKTLNLGSAPSQYGMRDTRPYYAYNLIEELDQPGEYYLDRSSGMLYLWPTSPLTGAQIQVSVLEGNLIELNGADHVTFRDLTFEAARGALVKINSGTGIRIERSLLRNAGEYAVQLSGSSNGVNDCEIVDCNDDGVVVYGGDRASLTPGNNFVTNSRIHRVGRTGWTYKPGVCFEGGAGNRAANNLLDDMPHTAILFSGNNHLIEYNEIRRVCQSDERCRRDLRRRRLGLSRQRHSLQFHSSHRVHPGRGWSARRVPRRLHQRHRGVWKCLLPDCQRSRVLRRRAGQYHPEQRHGAVRSWSLQRRSRTTADQWHSGPLFERPGANHVRRHSVSIKPLGVGLSLARRHPQFLGGDPDRRVAQSAGDGLLQQRWLVQRRVDVREQCVGLGGVRSLRLLREQQRLAFRALRRPGERRSFGPAGPAQCASVSGFQPIAFSAIGPSTGGSSSVTQPPAAPVLSGHATSSTQIDLSWADNSNRAEMQEAGFGLESRSSSGGWQLVQSLAGRRLCRRHRARRVHQSHVSRSRPQRHRRELLE